MMTHAAARPALLRPAGPPLALALGESGKVKALDAASGRAAWETATAAGWHAWTYAYTTMEESGLSMSAEALARLRLFADHGTVASVTPFASLVGGVEDSVLAVGGGVAVLAADGRLLGDLELRTPPAGPPVLADVDGDGAADVLLPCSDGLYVFLLRPSPLPDALPFLLALLLFVAALAFRLTLTPEPPRVSD